MRVLKDGNDKKENIEMGIFFAILCVFLLMPSHVNAICSLSDDPLAGVHIEPVTTTLCTAAFEVGIKIDPPIGVTPLDVNFSAKALKGRVHNFFWDFGDGATCKGQNCAYTYEDPGVYIVRLFVSSDSKETVTKKLAVFVKEKGKGKH